MIQVRSPCSNCFLFTSDIDYLPVIEAVRRMGKAVYVFGYGDGLGEHSRFEYVPDQFLDLGKRMNSNFVRNPLNNT